MEFGVSTLLFFDEVGIEGHFDCLASHGVNCIEIRNTANHLPAQENPQALRTMRRALRASGLRLHSIHLPGDVINGLSSLSAETRRSAVGEATQLGRVLAELDGRMLISHAGGPVEDEDTRPACVEAARESLAELAGTCRPLGVKLAVENALPGRPRLGIELGELLEITEGIAPATVGFCLDTSHANLSSSDSVAFLRALGNRLISLHLSDNDGKTDLHAPPFTGTVDWQAFMTELGRLDYQGVLMFEVRGSRPLPDILEELRNAFQELPPWAAY